jgi:hypothetical protein
MGDGAMTTQHETEALTYVRAANTQLRRLVHEYLTRRVTLTPDEALEAQRELAALRLGAAWLSAKLEDTSASVQDE